MVFILLFGVVSLLYDKKGVKVLILSALISVPFPILVFGTGSEVWLLGVLYDRSIPVMIAISVIAQLAAIPLYLGSASFRSTRE